MWQNMWMPIDDPQDPTDFPSKPSRTWWQGLVQRITAMPWAARFMTHRLHRWDRWVYRLSRGRWTATEFMAGLPVIFITTTGSRTGLPRVTPLLAIKHDGAYLLIATKFGADTHPDWYFNLKANPRVDVVHQSKHETCLARELEGDERQAAWDFAVEYYPGYQAYEQRAESRLIPVISLSPLPE